MGVLVHFRTPVLHARRDQDLARGNAQPLTASGERIRGPFDHVYAAGPDRRAIALGLGAHAKEKILAANAVRETGMIVRKRDPLRAAMAFIHHDDPAAIACEIDGGGQPRRTAPDNQSVAAILRHIVRGFLLERPGRLVSEPTGSTL